MPRPTGRHTHTGDDPTLIQPVALAPDGSMGGVVETLITNIRGTRIKRKGGGLGGAQFTASQLSPR